MKKTKISKSINTIRKSTDYDLAKIVNDMKHYYNTNNFENKVLLDRLRELSLEKFYMDSLQGGLIGLLLSVFIMDLGIYKDFSKLLDSAFTNSLLLGIVILLVLIIIMFVLALIILGVIKFIKYLQYKMVRSDILNNYLDEIEEKIIKDILHHRVEDTQE